MDASRDEFLLLIQKWKNSSASVIIGIAHGGSGPMPVSTSLIVRLKGTVVGIDETTSLVAFLIGEDGVMCFGFDNAEFSFGTLQDVPPESLPLFAVEEELEEMITMRQVSGLMVSFLMLK
jgi:hypothetical protein